MSHDGPRQSTRPPTGTSSEAVPAKNLSPSRNARQPLVLNGNGVSTTISLAARNQTANRNCLLRLTVTGDAPIVVELTPVWQKALSAWLGQSG